MSETLDYPRLMRDALLGVIREALRQVAAEGLPGEHHFYVSFRTDAPGVAISSSLRARHPREMTIVLQNQFWELVVDEGSFAVTLRFDGSPQRLEVPLEAITAFVDPSAEFGLRLAPDTDQAEREEGREGGEEPKPGTVVPFRPPADD